MAYIYNSYWLLCLISLKGLETAKIYIIDVPIAKDTDLQTDNDYGFSYDDENVLLYNQEKLLLDEDNERANVMCQRILGSIYGNEDQHIRCLNALKKNRAKGFDRPTDRFDLIKSLKDLQNQVEPFSDLARFSQDYLDVKDLARTNFASDYVDVNDFRTTRSVIPDCKNELDEFGQTTKSNCVPVSRKTLDNQDGNFRFKVDDVSEENVLRKKHKRYKVVSNESDKSQSGSDDENESGDFDNNFGSGSSMQNSDSIEVTTKKPKKKNKKSHREISDPYLYLQGNTMYDQDDFRRNKLQHFRNGNDNENSHSRYRRDLRLSHFLPKRIHFDEDELQNLGYYWFNGPRGKYKNS